MAAELIASWEEPHLEQSKLTDTAFLLCMIGIAVLVIVFIAGGILQKKTTYWFGALAIAVIGLTLYTQRKRGSKQLTISVTTEFVQIGPKVYAAAELAGFWLEEGFGTLAVNLEQKRPGMIPLTCIFANTDSADAREIFSIILPELEARERTFADKITGYFHL